MTEALDEAEKARREMEVPVGAVIVRDGEVVARAHNRREALADPTAHAEVLALREAARVLGGWRLHGAAVYATLEPCVMCMGALLSARVSLLVYGCDDPKAGAAGTLYDLSGDTRLNHSFEVIRGVEAGACAAILKEFFVNIRK